MSDDIKILQSLAFAGVLESLVVELNDVEYHLKTTKFNIGLSNYVVGVDGVARQIEAPSADWQ